VTDEEYAALKARAAGTKRLADALKAEFSLPATSSAFTIGVDAQGRLRIVLVAEGLVAHDARRLIALALECGVAP
jgi:hypothetical protein